MTNEEFVFQQTNRERKRIGTGSYAKRNGSRTRKCTLPSDSLTAGQLRKRNGEIMQYNLNKPMKWQEFRSMPEDLQKEYLEKLAREKKARGIDIAEMLGTRSNYFSRYVKDLYKGKTPFTGTHQVKMAQEWEAFIRADISPSAEAETAEVNSPTESAGEAERENERVKQQQNAEPKKKVRIKKGYVCYEGCPQDVFSKLILGLDPEQIYGFEILFYMPEEVTDEEAAE